jgi:copper homeostasis protein
MLVKVDPAVGQWDSITMDVEICVDSVESAIAAAKGGAERIELCSALSDGGITPSAGLITAVRAAVSIDLFVMIRPRGGDFVYSNHELEVMRRDIIEAKSRGVNGVVLGVLTKDATVDRTHTRSLIELARPLQVTFHRAFDVCSDMDRALEDVVACGADRLLTSGGKADALRGEKKIAHLNQRADRRIRIMAGGGIRASNVRALALRTGIRDVHTSLSTKVKGAAFDGGVELDSRQGEFTRYLVNVDDVRAFKSALLEIPVETKPAAPVQ